ncbi:MAG: heavy metal translocating P-type ATPase, partial [Sphingobacterium sp.]|nr:heavy metal translocating P-type ATPase [Sphingobacterium sp.]
MKRIHLTPISEFKKNCTCSTCDHQEIQECVEAKCNCCNCYETSGNLAIKPNNHHSCTCEHDDCCHDDPCGDECCKNEHHEDSCTDDCCDDEDEHEHILNEVSPLDRALSSAVYQVSGMDCPACARTIEKSVSQMPGIAGVQVNYSTGKMRVAYSDVSTLSSLSKQLSNLGYQIKPKVNLSSQNKSNVRENFKI